MRARREITVATALVQAEMSVGLPGDRWCHSTAFNWWVEVEMARIRGSSAAMAGSCTVQAQPRKKDRTDDEPTA